MQQIASLQQAFEKYLQARAFNQEPQGLYGPADYIMKSTGKRVRPVLAMLGCQIFGGDLEKGMAVGLAVEVFHNFSLVHDDIMDEAPLRRGKPAVHTVYGLNAGILSGDVMLIYAYKFLLEAGKPEVAAKLVEIFNGVAIEVCEGQQYDVDFETREDVAIPEYIRMIELKTAALIGGALQMGGVAAQGDAESVSALCSFGRSIGIAFQLQDDILDTFGDPAKFGKKVGGDIAQNKKTFLILKAMQLAQGKDRERLAELMSSYPEDEAGKIKEVTALLRQLDIPQWAEALKAKYQAQAYEALQRVKGDEAVKKVLWGLSESLMQRQS
ncbi:polyprenyl synthetase family protein [Phaeodactylibacter luteus]|uniref:Polyprenyl synthetase family protein n=1 Tax=Phaeodactylibacter luteus TaxID=1564516 RepID=A0A5C6S9D8_9BACT|nr:polyprenyl synthetase family protein [Phaeodactylibacter luteus]TXB70194.1 polyprenyl synthetase family protein [Phaeodactylibacter luteus]